MTPSLERLQALCKIRSTFEMILAIGEINKMELNKEKCKALPLGRRNQNPKHTGSHSAKDSDSVTESVYFIRVSKGRWGVQC